MHKKVVGEVEIRSLVELLEQQEPGMQSLFAKAINLYVAPNADKSLAKEKIEQLKKAVEESSM